ncbi:ubiquitin system component Cue protein [Actinidia rufa]|uniref:Ubiquitin system component Cue protein n=1 Tax=Actinidia rufa TaxID=165716 RepID=A0A7J0HCQ8_9ERIC|nr:ubiquitin system component Cue protein [Actinidia rufa]
MSAVVCGKRSSFFEDLPQSPKVSTERTPCLVLSSEAHHRLVFISIVFFPSCRLAGPGALGVLVRGITEIKDGHAMALYRMLGMTWLGVFCLGPRGSFEVKVLVEIPRLLEKALEDCGNNLNLAIRSLNELRLGPAENLGLAATECDFTRAENMQFQASGVVITNAEVSSPEDPSAPENLPTNGADWVELFVREMTSASNMDDAKVRASRALEVLEKSICARTTSEAAQTFQQENVMLKEQVELLVHENSVLKRAVSIQHERQKEFEDRTRELHHLKQLASQCQ